MKKTIGILLILCLVLSLGVMLVACDKDKPTEDDKTATTDYKVLVACSEGSVLDAVKVKLVNLDGTDATEEKGITNGVVEFSVKTGVYSVKLVNLPEEYEEPIASLTATTHTATLILNKKSEQGENDNNLVTYKVTLKKPDGSVVPDFMLQICSSGNCFPKMTDSEGVATFNLPADTYEVHIPNCPEGFTFDDTEYTVSSESTEVVVYLK